MKTHTISMQIKSYARRALIGNLRLTVGSNLLYLLLVFLLGRSAALIGETGGVIFTILGIAAAFLVLVLQGMLQYGLCTIYMKIYYGSKASLKDMFCGFRESSSRIMVVQVLLSLIEVIPAAAIGLLHDYWNRPVAIAVIILSFFIMILLYIRYALVYYVMIDFPQLSGVAAMKQSRRLMKGRIWSFLYLILSFLPLYLISLLSFGVASIWVMAYVDMTATAFYAGVVAKK